MPSNASSWCAPRSPSRATSDGSLENPRDKRGTHRVDGSGIESKSPGHRPWRWRVGLYAGFCSGPCGPLAAIHLGRRLPAGSSGLPGVDRAGPPSPCSALLRMGFTEPSGSPRMLVRSYRTVSPLPVRGRSGDRSRHRRSVLCGTFLRVAPTGCYPAPCPVESGRSSGRCAEAPGTRPPGRLATAHHCRAQTAVLPSESSARE